MDSDPLLALLRDAALLSPLVASVPSQSGVIRDMYEMRHRPSMAVLERDKHHLGVLAQIGEDIEQLLQVTLSWARLILRQE